MTYKTPVVLFIIQHVHIGQRPIKTTRLVTLFPQN